MGTVDALLSSPCFKAAGPLRAAMMCCAGCEVNARDARGFTALHWAAHQVAGDIAARILQEEELGVESGERCG